MTPTVGQRPDRRAPPRIDSGAMDESAEPDPPTAVELEADPSLEQLADHLAGVERALERLEDGSYWTDEVSGEALPDELLAEDPTARRAPPPPADASPG
jgi:RNA polymerase-binding transcription factor DksA